MLLRMMRNGEMLLRMMGSEHTPHDNERGTPHGPMGRHLTTPVVIPNVVRNLRSGSDGLSITTASLCVSRHFRFFGVRSSE